MSYIYILTLAIIGLIYAVGTIKCLMNGEMTLSSWQGTEACTFSEAPIKYIYMLVLRVTVSIVTLLGALILFAVNRGF